jgi:hypothetical protein
MTPNPMTTLVERVDFLWFSYLLTSVKKNDWRKIKAFMKTEKTPKTSTGLIKVKNNSEYTD